MEYRHQYDEIMKHFGEGRLKGAGGIQKDLQLRNVNIVSYYTEGAQINISDAQFLNVVY